MATTPRPLGPSLRAASPPLLEAPREKPLAMDHAPAAMTSSTKPIEGGSSGPSNVKRSGLRRRLVLAASVVGLVLAGYLIVPLVETMLYTVSTDDAYVNGHVTFVAPRVAGQVAKVLVDDNYRVKKGDLLVQLDPEPFKVQVAMKRAAVGVAEGDLEAAEALARGQEALARSQRWRTQTAAQQVRNQIALLQARVAALNAKKATLERAKADFERYSKLVKQGAVTQQDFDLRQQDIRVAEADVNQAREEAMQVRASLGLPHHTDEEALSKVPEDLEETFSDVRMSVSELVQTMAQLGRPLESSGASPSKVLASFRELDKDGDVEGVMRDIIPKVPAVVQAKARLQEARHDLEQAELNLRYCDVVSEIDGVVTRRNVNPGNNVHVGESLMAVRSLTEIWIDANFKETQLADLRIGHRVAIEADMYGSHKEFEGRITGFTMGTGQTLALLPPQNATGNFVKIVQRLPVRIELTNYDPDRDALFVGLSVTPYVYYREEPAGPGAGHMLQPEFPLPQRPVETLP